MRRIVRVDMGLLGWIHNTNPNIILRMNVNGVYMCPSAFFVYYNYPAKPAISYKLLAVINLYEANNTNPITSITIKIETNISTGWELASLKLKTRSGRLTIENKSVIFWYFILLTAFFTIFIFGLYLFTTIKMMKVINNNKNNMISTPWDRKIELSLWYSINFDALNA